MYIIFFGKSQSFEFHAFDEKGIINNFDSIIKDFELLESKWFTIDKIDNKPILSRYEFASNNTKYCLLKLYGFAQAADGARVEGSTYGVAFLSQEPLTVSDNNIKLLSLLLKYFSDLCLSNSKFKKQDFKEDSYSIWKAFANQIGYGKIEKGKYLSKFENASNNAPIGFFVSDLEKSATISESYLSRSSLLYFSTDIEHLKRTREKWNKRFEFYASNQQGTILYTDPKIKENKDTSKSSNPQKSQEINYSEIRLTELEKEIINTKKNHKKDNIYHKKFILFTSVVSIVFAFLYFNTFFKDKTKEQTDNTITTVVQTNNNIDFSKIVVDSIMKDTARSQFAVDFFRNYLKYVRDKSNDTVEKKKNLLKIFMDSGKKFKIDSLKIIEAIKIK